MCNVIDTVNEVRDLYHAEKQLVRALPRLTKSTNSPDLRHALTSHLEETERQVERLEGVFEQLGERAQPKPCEGMSGILKEGFASIGDGFDGDVADAAIIAAAQRVEHYEIAAYGTAAAWAKALGLTEVETLLAETLGEEKAADKKLTSLAEHGINAAATHGSEGESMSADSEAGGAERNSRRSRPSANGRSRSLKSSRSATRQRSR